MLPTLNTKGDIIFLDKMISAEKLGIVVDFS